MAKLKVVPLAFANALEEAAEMSSRGPKVGPSRLVRLYRAGGDDAILQVVSTDGMNILCKDVHVDGPDRTIDLLIEARKLEASGLAARNTKSPIELDVVDDVLMVKSPLGVKVKTKSIVDPSWSFDVGFDGMISAGTTTNRWDVFLSLCKYAAVLEKTHSAYAQIVMLAKRCYVPGMISQVRAEVSLFSSDNEFLPCSLPMSAFPILKALDSELSVMIGERAITVVGASGFAKLQRGAADVRTMAKRYDEVFSSLSVAGEIVIDRDDLRTALKTVSTGFSGTGTAWGYLTAMGDEGALLTMANGGDEIEVELATRNTGRWKFPVSIQRLSQFADRSVGDEVAVRSMHIDTDKTDRWKSVVHFVDGVLHEATGVPVHSVGQVEEITE